MKTLSEFRDYIDQEKRDAGAQNNNRRFDECLDLLNEIDMFELQSKIEDNPVSLLTETFFADVKKITDDYKFLNGIIK